MKLSRRTRQRLPLYALVLLTGFASLQALWWVWYQLLEGVHYRELSLQLLEERVRLAEVDMASKPQLTREEQASFSNRYPGLVLAFSTRFPSGYAPVIDTHRQAAIWAESRRRSRMFALEGGVFVIILGAGVWFQARAYRRELRHSEQQSNFVSAVTHELKSPLTTIRLFGELARREGLDEGKRAEISTRILESTDRLNQLVDQILLARTLEGDHFQLELQPVDLDRWLESWAETAGQVARNAGFSLELHRQHHDHERACWIQADAKALDSVLANLFGNAMKYSPEKGPLSLHLNRTRQFVELQLRDQGIGFHQTEAPLLFDRFFRAGSELRRTTRGTGLGLYIVRELVLRLGGRVGAESDGPGKGACFTVTLPLLKHPPDRAAPGGETPGETSGIANT
jgi:signal transduction histidine kinase